MAAGRRHPQLRSTRRVHAMSDKGRYEGMLKAFLRVAAVAFTALMMAGRPAHAEMSAEEKAEIGQVIRDYLLANPEVLEEAITILQERRAAEEVAAQTKTIEENKSLIFASDHQM